ncbi:SEL1-like repeat protein [Pontibacter sp. JH31]|uniref:SEL1-like repeat protein n=1 Tax=Pontibacter aquaedesilientis TaxID=2766980 RepID=A0ABR7XC01_9BACT|nr:ankyrin repeat domain-containing protein [Pontibacter aquaedesilientis]MBD1395827.1 SEL1-like repeat protein [Pontibacter aquaedesilientis]
MKRLFLILLLLPASHLAMALTGTNQHYGSVPAKQSVRTDTSINSKATKQETLEVYRTARQVWRTPEMQEAVDLYMGLQYKEAYEKFRQAAAREEAAAYYFMGRMHQYGELKDSDALSDSLRLRNPETVYAANPDSARALFELALEGNNLLGNLGLAEMMTLRNEEDKKRFTQLMRSAAVEIREMAVAGDAFCNRILGSMYYTGYGEMQDKEYAFNYIQRAANRHDVVAYTSLANLYLTGEGVEANTEKAKYWLERGVAAGSKEALYTLGLLYEEGNLGEPEPEKARELYHQAIAKGSANAFEQLKYLSQTADQKLVLAAIERNPDIVKRSLSNGANVNTLAVPNGYDFDFRLRTPLMHGIFIPLLLEDYGVIYKPDVRLQVASELLRKGADVNATDQDGKTALHYAMSGARINTELFEIEQARLLDTLFKFRADPNIVDNLGNTPLFYAVRFANGTHLMEMNRLLQGGANPNIQNLEGKTPLMLACELDGGNEVIVALLSAGADPGLRDYEGRVAIDFTKRESVHNILLAAGSRGPKR